MVAVRAVVRVSERFACRVVGQHRSTQRHRAVSSSLHFIPPGQPWRNGYVESFNARVRDECLSINAFWSLTHARVVISDW